MTVDHLQNEGYAYSKRYRTEMIDLLSRFTLENIKDVKEAGVLNLVPLAFS